MYTGSAKDGKRQGTGIIESEFDAYEGDWDNDDFKGFGKITLGLEKTNYIGHV